MRLPSPSISCAAPCGTVHDPHVLCAALHCEILRSYARLTARLGAQPALTAGAHSGRSQRALTALAPIRIANVSKPHRPFANLECDFRNSGHPVLDDLPGTLLALRAHLPDCSKQVLNSDQAFLACCRRSVLLHRHRHISPAASFSQKVR